MSVSRVKQTFLPLMSQGKVSRSLLPLEISKHSILLGALQAANPWIYRTYTGGTCWSKEREGVNIQSRNLRLMERKEVYRDGEVRVALQNQAELPEENVEDHCSFCSPVGAPHSNTPIRGWG